MILDAGSGSLYIQLFYSPRVYMCVIYVNFWVPVGSWAAVTFDTIFYSIFPFRSYPVFFQKVCRVSDSITLEGSLFHWFVTHTVKKFCLSPFSDLCQYSLRMWPLAGRLVELPFCIGINSVTDLSYFPVKILQVSIISPLSLLNLKVGN